MNESSTGTLSFVEGSIHRRLHDLHDFELWFILRLILRQILSQLLISIHCNGNARIFISCIHSQVSLDISKAQDLWRSMHSNLYKHKHELFLLWLVM